MKLVIDDETVSGPAINQVRKFRNAQLTACDWTQTLDSPLTDEQRQAWSAYRQALRDFPSTWTFGPTAEFPDPPGV
jgi:hypothetical protein